MGRRPWTSASASPPGGGPVVAEPDGGGARGVQNAAGGVENAAGGTAGVAVQHGWLARGEHEVPRDVGDVEAWLTPPEAERLAQLRFTKRRTEFLLRRWTAKHAVAVALGVADVGASGAEAPGGGASVAALARIAVLNRMSGAPYVLVDGEPAGVDVSVTDRAGWAVCLVGAGLDAVGVDLELVEPRSDGFVADFLTASEADEVVEYVSLGAGNTGKAFDLETNKRVAEFKFITWRGGADTIRQNGLFVDLFNLASSDTTKRRELYVLGKREPDRFLNGRRAIPSVLTKHATVKERFDLRHAADGYLTVRQYWESVRDQVEIIDLRDKVPVFGAEAIALLHEAESDA